MFVKKKIVSIKIQEEDTTQNWKLQKQLLGLLGNQPDVATKHITCLPVPVD